MLGRDRAELYTLDTLELVRRACLYVATRLGDLMEDLTVVGGLVPTLLIDRDDLPAGTEPHVGTRDLDIALSVGLLEEERYRELSKRLRMAGFEPDRNPQGRLIRQRWRFENPEGIRVTIDFLIPPTREEDVGGTLRDIEEDFAAIITPGLHLAFEDRVEVELNGITLLGEQARRHIWICGPAAYIVLKALAFDGRGDEKDAYDLYFVVRNIDGGPDRIGLATQPLLGDSLAQQALAILRRDFSDHGGIGPRRVAEFISGAPDDEIQADVVGFVAELLRVVDSL